MLPNYTAGAEVANDQAKEVSLGRVLSYNFAVQVVPKLGASRAGPTVDRANDADVEFIVLLYPLKEEPHEIVVAQPRRRGVRDRSTHVLSLFVRCGLIPDPEPAANKTQELLVL